MPNRLEPLTNEILNYIQDKGKKLDNLDRKDSLKTDMENWLTLGMQAGFRISKWAQNYTHLSWTKIFKTNVNNFSTTFTIDDIIFFSKRKRRIDAKKHCENWVTLKW